MDRLRAEAVVARKLPLLEVEASLQQEAQRFLADAGEPVTDERLRLVLLCAHPSLAPASAAALTLRLVLGVSTEDVARLFLVSTPTMAARLTRARRRLAGRAFEVPADLGPRLALAAQVAYLAFTAGYAPGSGPDVVRALLALMLLQHSRRDARVADGRLVLLPDQDRRRWHAEEIAEALALLRRWLDAPPSPYLLQALIAAEHAVAPSSAETAWHRIVLRYEELEELTGSPVVRLNRAVAVAEDTGPEAGLEVLEGLTLPGHRLAATRAELLARAGRTQEAATAYDEAIGRCANGAERAHLVERRLSLRPPPG